MGAIGSGRAVRVLLVSERVNPPLAGARWLGGTGIENKTTMGGRPPREEKGCRRGCALPALASIG